MENNGHSQPPPGYPTAAGAEQQGGKKARRGSTTSRGEKGFIEGCYRCAVLLLDLRDVLRLASSLVRAW
ncbi:hypothetical protein ACP70R_036082 [Stipagrostis hirtigluma subsp. patula]